MSALLLVAALAASTQTLPAIPKLPLETYEASVRAPIEQALRAAEAQPRDAERAGQLGMVLYANEQYEFAAACFARAQALAPDEPRWPYFLGRTQSNLATEDRGMAALRRTLRLQPDYLPAQVLLAKALVESGQTAEGRQLYEALLRARPDTAEAHYALGKLDAAGGQADAAIEHLRRACALWPSFGAAHFALARLYRDRGRAEEAQAEVDLYEKDKLGWPTVPDPFMSALASLKGGAAARLDKGVQLAEAGQLQAAAEEHEAALRADPKLLLAHVNLIRIYGTLGQNDRAEEHYRAGVALDPNLAELHYNHGVVLMGEGRGAEAAEAFRRAVELKPTYADAQNNYAYLLMSSGKLDEAVEHYQAAIAARPDHRAAHFNLGRILVNQGKLAEAIDQLAQTLEPDDEDSPRCTYALGAAYARAGNRSEALKYLTQARAKAEARGQADLVASIDKDLRRLEAGGR